MTREEKINQLNDIFAEINEDDNAVCYLTSEDNELIESAIKALEQECEDAISRKYAIDAVANLFEMGEYPHPYPQGKPIRLKDIKEKLKQLPPVQPKPIECEDAISRAEAQTAIEMSASRYTIAKEHNGMGQVEWSDQLIKVSDVVDIIRNLSSIKLLEQQPCYNPDEWCKTCKEYDHNKHCCPRYNNVIRQAVEEIKQESCEDAISRESAIGAVANLFEMSEYPHPYSQGKPIRLREIKEKLKQLPSVQPKIKTGHWIPISERLPEESDYVSCLPFYDGTVIWITDKGIMGFGWYYNSTNNWADTNDFWSDKYGEVTAWMPLPEPYKPRESEDKE